MLRIASLLSPIALCAPLLAWTVMPLQGAQVEPAKLVVGETRVASLPPASAGAGATSVEWLLLAEEDETVTVALESNAVAGRSSAVLSDAADSPPCRAGGCESARVLEIWVVINCRPWQV
jgi:hypothetical protein